MREVTVTNKVYKFEELTKEVQESVLEKLRNTNEWCWDCFDSENLTEYFRDECKEFGFDYDVKVTWSLSSSQGDGVAFMGDIEIGGEWIGNHADDFSYDQQRRLNWLRREYGLNVKVYNSGYYSHWNSMTYEVECDYESHLEKPELLDEVIHKLYDVVKREVQELSRRLEKEGYAEIDSHYTDEYIKDGIEANDREFLEDGELWS